jgi:hypothetical protein
MKLLFGNLGQFTHEFICKAFHHFCKTRQFCRNERPSHQCKIVHCVKKKQKIHHNNSNNNKIITITIDLMQVFHHEHYNNHSHAIMNESQYGNGRQTNIGQQ